MNFIMMLAKCEQIEFSEEKLPKAICDVSENLEIFITLENVDLSGILTRLENQKISLKKKVSSLTPCFQMKNSSLTHLKRWWSKIKKP